MGLSDHLTASLREHLSPEAEAAAVLEGRRLEKGCLDRVHCTRCTFEMVECEIPIMCSHQICSSCVMLVSEHCFSTLVNQCHEELR